MNFLKRLGLSVVIAALAMPTWAANYGSASTYSNLVWKFTSSVSGLPSCPQMFADVTGDFVNSTHFSMYGVLNCPASNSGYAVTGNAYFGNNGRFNVNVMIGGFWQVNCPNMLNFAGTCTVQNASGAILGSGFLSLT